LDSNLEDDTVSGLRPTYPLRTERLDLRPHRMDDLDDLYAFHSRPEVVRYTPWPVRDRERTRVALEAKLTQDALTEPGQWLCAVLDDRNTASANLLERLGVHREAHLIHCVFFKGEWANEYIYALREDTWRPTQP
jgi:RimJ/RimL family protein N-acetyltransferase